jgi:hypothetical protein
MPISFFKIEQQTEKIYNSERLAFSPGPVEQNVIALCGSLHETTDSAGFFLAFTTLDVNIMRLKATMSPFLISRNTADIQI